MSFHSVKEKPEKEERIRAAAYLIWEREGRPDGHALAHWIKATEVVEAEEASGSDVLEKGPAESEQTPKRARSQSAI